MATTTMSSKTTTHVTFVCQKCTRPIKLNRSLQAKDLVVVAKSAEEKLSVHLSEKSEETNKADQEDENDGDVDQPVSIPRSSPQVGRRIFSRRSSETVSVIYDSLQPKDHEKKNTLKQIQIASETFKMLSSHMDIDHPLCCDCPEAVLESFDTKIKNMEEAKGHYDQLATRLEQEVGTYKSEMSQLDSELKALHKEEELLKIKAAENRKPSWKYSQRNGYPTCKRS